MPKLNQNRVERVPTYMNLPRTTRDSLEQAIGCGNIRSLTDAVVEAARLLARHMKKQNCAKPPNPN